MSYLPPIYISGFQWLLSIFLAVTLVQAPPSHLDNWSPCPLRQATGLFLKSKPTTPPLISKLSRRYPGYIYWLSRSCPMVPCLRLPTCQPAHCVPATWTFCPASDMPSSFPPQGFCICHSVGFTSSHPVCSATSFSSVGRQLKCRFWGKFSSRPASLKLPFHLHSHSPSYQITFYYNEYLTVPDLCIYFSFSPR